MTSDHVSTDQIAECATDKNVCREMLACHDSTLQAGDVDGAISQFRSAISLAPDYATAHQRLAEALQWKGEKEEAEEEFRKAANLIRARNR